MITAALSATLNLTIAIQVFIYWDKPSVDYDEVKQNNLEDDEEISSAEMTAITNSQADKRAKPAKKD